MKKSFLKPGFLLTLIFLTVFQSYAFSNKNRVKLDVSRIGFSPLEYDSTFKSIYFDVNYVYAEDLKNSFNDLGLTYVKYLAERLTFNNPATETIKDLCKKHGLDAYILTKIQFTVDSKPFYSKEKFNYIQKMFISMKLFKSDGVLIDSATVKYNKALKIGTPLEDDKIMYQSVESVILKLVKNLHIQTTGFSLEQITKQTWHSFNILLKDGNYQSVKPPLSINLCLYTDSGYYLELIPDSSKRIHSDKYNYNQTDKEIILHSKDGDLSFIIVGFDENILVLRPKNIAKIQKIYFRCLSETEIAEMLKPAKDSVRIVQSVFDPRTGKTTGKDTTEVLEDPIFFVVQESATFQGGDLNNFMDYIYRNAVYPKEAQERGMSGKAIFQFVIGSDGNIKNIKIIRSSGFNLLDKEAIRVLRSSPKWKPGRQGGKAVNQLFTIPVTFINRSVIN